MPRPYNSIEDLHQDVLENVERVYHREIAGLAAVRYCLEHNLPIPPWASARSQILSCTLLNKSAKKSPGRAVGPIERYQQDMRDYARAAKVKEVEEQQQLLSIRLKEISTIKGMPPQRVERTSKLNDWVGKTRTRAFECASMLLIPSGAFGSPRAVKKSFQKVQREPDPTRYYMFERSLLRQLGIRPVWDEKPGTKFVEMYDLKLAGG